jgi:hypothetical protein
MKTHSYSPRSVILLVMALLFVNAFAAGQAMGADPRSPHAVAPSQAPARLVIRRMPNLGFNVIVRLWIDGQSAATLGYGHTYHGFLTPGRHVLAVLATPRSRSPIPWEMPLNVQSGQTYIFTATGGSSGDLILASGF